MDTEQREVQVTDYPLYIIYLHSYEDKSQYI
jgi:hypothetical protein